MLTAMSGTAERPRLIRSHAIAASGMAIMLCFQKPANTIKSKGPSTERPDGWRNRNQTNPRPMIASPASWGSFAPA